MVTPNAPKTDPKRGRQVHIWSHSHPTYSLHKLKTLYFHAEFTIPPDCL